MMHASQESANAGYRIVQRVRKMLRKHRITEYDTSF